MLFRSQLQMIEIPDCLETPVVLGTPGGQLQMIETLGCLENPVVLGTLEDQLQMIEIPDCLGTLDIHVILVVLDILEDQR